MARDKIVLMKAILPGELVALLKDGPCRLEPVYDDDGNLIYALASRAASPKRGHDPRRTHPL